MNTIQKIVQVAQTYLNEQEIPYNKGFKNPEFQTKMQAVGWEKGEAWCATFAELVYKEAYADFPDILKELDRLHSKSAVQTHINFDKSDWKTIDDKGRFIKKPQLGALAVWRLGTGYSGHIGIVVEVESDTVFYSIEGNTNDKGGREGIEVAKKKRFANATFGKNKLNLIGFILPKVLEIPTPSVSAV